MFCESYREALNELAIGDGCLPADVQAHLASCRSCRESFSQQKALFERIESEVQSRVNAESPASLLPRVRQEIAASPAIRTWSVPVLAYVASGLAIGAIAISFAVRTRVPLARPEPPARAVSSPAPDEAGVRQRDRALVQMLVATRKRNPKSQQVARHAGAEVLVCPEEELNLRRYAASLRNTKAEASSVVKANAAAEIEPLQIASVDVKGLSIDPLQSGDSE